LACGGGVAGAEGAVFLELGLWHDRMLTVVTPGRGEPPRRHLKDWERDPDAEVSDGWLSNMCAGTGDVDDRLTWEPEFCHRPTWRIPCPDCDSELRARTGQWDAFYRCRSCSFRPPPGPRRRRPPRPRPTVVRWCGTRLVLMINNEPGNTA